MRFWEGLRLLVQRARSGASDMAKSASIRIDIRSLEGERDHLFREIGRKVYAAPDRAERYAEFEAQCAQIAQVEERLREKQQELADFRNQPASAQAQDARTAAG